jgi:ribosome biogenesis protein Tsr3
VYRIFHEDGYCMRIVKRKEEADHFVEVYGWSAKFFKDPKKEKEKEMLKNVEEAPF